MVIRRNPGRGDTAQVDAGTGKQGDTVEKHLTLLWHLLTFVFAPQVLRSIHFAVSPDRVASGLI